MIRLRARLPLLLVLAYLTALVAPLRTAWACADGTHCVLDETNRYVCPGGACSRRANCCAEEQTVACKHGKFPTVRPGSLPVSVQSPDHCEFNIEVAPRLVGAIEVYAPCAATADALPVSPRVELPLPVSTPFWRDPYSLGYRPPPLLDTGPSRAPPIL